MKVLVTGGTGLVGRHTIGQLVESGHEVHALVRSPEGVRFVERLGAGAVRGRVEVEESWNAAPHAEAIVHAAALVTAATNWDTYWQVNVQGTRLAATMAARTGARFVHISSVAVYGRRPSAERGHPVVEDTPPAPIADADYYARSKRMAEETVWETASIRAAASVALRPCVIYGEGERLFLARLLGVLRYGVAPLVGRGDNGLAVVYAGNVAQAVLAALERPDVTGPFNVTNDGRLTQREFFEIAGAALGTRMRFLRVPLSVAVAAGSLWHRLYRLARPGHYTGLGSSSGRFLARENPYSSERAIRELGWQPSVQPQEALRRTVRWFVDNGLVPPRR
jgi:nucleoside-diphosphate-sugar epimerase